MTALMVAGMTVLFSLQSLFAKLFSQKHGSKNAAVTSTVFSIVYGVFAGFVTLALGGFRFAPSRETLTLGLLNAVMLLLYNTSLIEASRRGSYSFQMICLLFGGIVPPMLHEVLFLGGTLTAVQGVAIGLMLASFVLMNLKGLTLKGSDGRFLFWCAMLFLTNGLYGILMNLQQRRMNGAERNEMIILTYLGMAVLYAVWALLRNRSELTEGFRMGREPLVWLLLCCASATSAAHLMMVLLGRMEASLLYTIDNGGVLVLSLLYSFMLFREKVNAAQIAGIALASVSIVMLSL